MLAKLLTLLFHAKAGLLSGVLLLGATGALVTVSTSGNVTTVTITQPSASPSALTTTATRSPKPTESPEPSESPKVSSSTSSSTTACTDEAKALELQVQRVNTAFSGYHVDLMHLRGQRATSVIETADATLKQIRDAAVKAIHATATATCAKQDDEDKTDTDQNEDKDTEANDDTSAVTGVTTVAFVSNDANDESNDGDHGKTTTTPITFTGTDATGIADQALAAMKVAFDAANSSPVLTAKPTHSPEVKNGKNDDSEHRD
jgi:hypothetical protein